MRTFALGLTTLLVVFNVAATHPQSSGKSQENPAAGNPTTPAQTTVRPMTIRGSIWDSVCAKAGSHGQMMPKVHATDVTQCTLACVANGAELVLFNTDDKTIFRVDSQDKVREYAGQVVTAKGNYDSATGILHIESISAL